MVDPRLVEYIRKGLGQGFNVAYIKEVLIKHGYKIDEVDAAMGAATVRKEQEPRKIGRSRPLLIGGIAVLGIAFLFLVISFERESQLTGGVTLVNLEQKLTVQEYLDQLAELSEKIDDKEGSIEKQIELIKELQFDVDQKDQVIAELENLYKAIKKEREEVKDLLLELLDEIIDRFNVQTE